MYLHVDLSQIPPTVELREPDDFTGFRAVVVAPSHTWVDGDALAGLGRGGDEAWNERFAQMLRFADGMGWIDGEGRVRAHLQVEDDGGSLGV